MTVSGELPSTWSKGKGKEREGGSHHSQMFGKEEGCEELDKPPVSEAESSRAEQCPQSFPRAVSLLQQGREGDRLSSFRTVNKANLNPIY